MLKTVGNPSTRYGDQTITDGNLVVGTSGKGIDFSATPGTGTSELLDDYEEGTWTPKYNFDPPPTTPFAMDVITAQYTKVGRKVTAKCWVRTNNVNISGAVGAFVLEGLPFAPDPSANNQYSGCFTATCSGFATQHPSAGYVSGTVIVLLYRTAADGSTSICTTSTLTTGAVAGANSLMITAEYFTAS